MQVGEVKGSNLHNCFQFTEVPCVNEEKYRRTAMRDTVSVAILLLLRMYIRSFISPPLLFLYIRVNLPELNLPLK